MQQNLLSIVYDVARLIRVRSDQRARANGMTRAQWIILIWLKRKPGISQNELACLVEVEPITVARLIDRLEIRGLVERRHDPKDRRLRRLHLTEAAEPLMAEIERYKIELDEQITAGLDEATLQRVLDALLTMKSNLQDNRPDRAEAV
jgi:MarR family transcriptional regulator for hemolysin